MLTVAAPVAGGTAIYVENRGATIPHIISNAYSTVLPGGHLAPPLIGASGLGLSIVRSIMSLHRGTCQAVSGDGVTRVHACLPECAVVPGSVPAACEGSRWCGFWPPAVSAA